MMLVTSFVGSQWRGKVAGKMRKKHPLVTLPVSLSGFWRSQFGKYLRREYTLSLTMEGWALVVTMSLIGLAALNTAAPLLYLLFSMMCAFFVLSALLASNTIRGLTVERRVPRLWPAQTPFRVEIFIRNSKKLTSSYSIRVSDQLERGGLMGAVFLMRYHRGTRPWLAIMSLCSVKGGCIVLIAWKWPVAFPLG